MDFLKSLKSALSTLDKNHAPLGHFNGGWKKVTCKKDALLIKGQIKNPPSLSDFQSDQKPPDKGVNKAK